MRASPGMLPKAGEAAGGNDPAHIAEMARAIEAELAQRLSGLEPQNNASPPGAGAGSDMHATERFQIYEDIFARVIATAQVGSERSVAKISNCCLTCA